MAETKRFQLEGDITLAYRGDEAQPRHVLVQDDPVEDEGPAIVGGSRLLYLEEYVAQQLGFPSDTEFDAMIVKLDGLRSQGLQPADDVPDIVREGVKLRITVEVL